MPFFVLKNDKGDNYMKNNNTTNGKRKDKKGRVLRLGETQQSDGRYRYSYTVNGKQKSVYSWRLEKTDRLPAGKRECVSLREQEQEIQKLTETHVIRNKITVLEMLEDYLKIHDAGLRRSTKDAHKYALDTVKLDRFFCGKKIIDVQISDVKKFFLGLQVNGATLSKLRLVKNIVFPAFRSAYEEQLILVNPASFNYSDLFKEVKEETPSLTIEQMNKFLDFIKNDENLCHRYEVVYILFHTGLRISEFCGLTLQDIDFKRRTITVERQLQVTAKGEMYIERPKTEKGNRILPLTDDVAECFQILRRRVMQRRHQPSLDGYSGFFSTALKNDGRPSCGSDWTSHFRAIYKKFIATYPDYPLPKVTPHVCRHTYCSHMAAAGIQPNVLQYLMGHSDVSTTLGTYTHVHAEEVKDAVNKALENLA